MLIVIPKDFLILNDESVEFNACVENLLAASYEGNHYILFEQPIVARNIADKCSVSDRAKATLKMLSVSSRENISLIHFVKSYSRIVSFKGSRCSSKPLCANGCEFDLSYFNSMEYVSPCKLLCEDSRDGEIYAQYFNVILKLENRSIPADIRFKVMHGGGSSTPLRYKNEFDANFLVLCIVDNDTKEPNGRGNYWDRLEAVGERDFAKFRVVCGHEIENSIPFSMLCDIPPNVENAKLYSIVRKSVELKQLFHLYLDFKKGIIKKELRKLSQAHRDCLVDFLISKCALDQDLFSCLKEDCSGTCGNCTITKGFSANLIENFFQNFLALSVQKKQECLAKSSVRIFLGSIYDTAVALGFASKKMRL